MASYWELSVLLIDTKQNKTRLNYDIGLISLASFEAEAAEANSRKTDIIAALEAISDANVYVTRLAAVDTIGGALPADADITDELVILVHTNDTNHVTELAQLRVPAPIAGVWLNNAPEQGLDPADAGVQTYVALFSADVQFSDGEHANTAEGTAGIASGYWRSVADKVKP